MNDLSIFATSIADALSPSIQSADCLSIYYTPHRDRNADLARTLDRLCNLFTTLQSADHALRTRSWQVSERATLHNIDRSVSSCGAVTSELQDVVHRLRKELGTSRQAIFPFRASTLQKLDEDITDLYDCLAIALKELQLEVPPETQNQEDDIPAPTPETKSFTAQGSRQYGTINIASGAQAHLGDKISMNDTTEVENLVRVVQAHQLDASVRQWLGAPDATVDYNNMRSKRHKETGQWLIQGPSFTTWLRQDNSLLWLYGFAGCGKSVLCSTAIQYTLQHRESSNDIAVAFFFFTFNDESKQDASAVLRALLLQLCTQVPDLQEDLSRLQKQYQHGTPPVLVLLEHLRKAATRCLHMYILLDALDESPIGPSRDEVLSAIEAIRQWQLTGLHLMVTSRDIPDIRDLILSQNGICIALNSDSVQQDISQYISFQVDHDRQLQRWDNHREKIKSYLTQRANGVFRWVECQLQPLRQCPHSEKHLEKCLRALPRSLDETYERILCGIESQEEARQILWLLCCAIRPLSVDEVVEALAVDVDGLEDYDPRSRFTDGADDLVRICPGLIEIGVNCPTKSDNDFSTNVTIISSDEDHVRHSKRNDEISDTSIRGTQMVRIAHFSVQEYLLSDRIKKSPACDFALSERTQHGRISKACLLYLSYDNFLNQPLSTETVEYYAFASYAAEYWCHHYHQADKEFAEQLTERIAAFLTTHQTKKRWLKLYDPDNFWQFVNYDELATDYPSSVYYTSLLGLHHALAHVLSTSTVDINAREGRDFTALRAASRGGHAKVVQILLDAKADINARGDVDDLEDFHNDCTALQLASEFGHEKVVELLLNSGAEVDAQGTYNGTALCSASAHGHEKVVQMLIDAGASLHINSKGVEGGPALYLASEFGYEKIVQRLLNAGAEPNPRGLVGTALYGASERGYEEIVQMLLDAGAEVNAGGGYHGTALGAASANGYDKIVQKLLNAGAEVNLGRERLLGDSALHLASKNGHEKVVNILLDAGAFINAQSREGTALRAAIADGHRNVVHMLLDAGAVLHFGRYKPSSLHEILSPFGDDREKMLQKLQDNFAKYR